MSQNDANATNTASETDSELTGESESASSSAESPVNTLGVDEPKDTSSISTRLIAAVAAGLVGALLFLFGLWLYCRRRKAAKRQPDEFAERRIVYYRGTPRFTWSPPSGTAEDQPTTPAKEDELANESPISDTSTETMSRHRYSDFSLDDGQCPTKHRERCLLTSHPYIASTLASRASRQSQFLTTRFSQYASTDSSDNEVIRDGLYQGAPTPPPPRLPPLSHLTTAGDSTPNFCMHVTPPTETSSMSGKSRHHSVTVSLTELVQRGKS